MTKQEIYEELGKVTINERDYILVNNEVILQNLNLDDDWFEIVDYADDEETFKDYSFEKVEYVDGDLFKKEDGEVVEVEFKQPTGCVIRYEIK